MRKPYIRSDFRILPACRELCKHVEDIVANLTMVLLYAAVIPVVALWCLWLPERSAKRTAWEDAMRARRFEDT